MMNWHNIMQSWDDQQTAYLPYREERFKVMLDVLDSLFDGKFNVLDLACGPASISARVLDRFPAARCIAADIDPILMEIGKQVLDANPRITWLDIDLNHPSWSVNGNDSLGWLKTQSIDAVLTTTALHWLPPEALTRVYLELGDILAPGGVVMNGDHMMFLPHMTTFRQLSESAKEQQYRKAFDFESKPDYAAWWQSLRDQLLQTDPELYGQMFEEREQRFKSHQGDFSEPIRLMHQAALHNAGFVEVGPIWQRFDNCVLLGIRGLKQAPVKN